MSIGFFTDKHHRPTENEIAEAIGTRIDLWRSAIQGLCQSYPVAQDIRFLYGKNYGWARRFVIKGKALTSMFPGVNCFVAQINIPRNSLAQLEGLKLRANAQRAVESATLYPEGKWLFVTIESPSDLRDARRLIDVRADALFPSLRAGSKPTG